MTVNSFLKAFAARIGVLFPGRLVFVDQLPAEADGNFFVRCVEQNHKKGLDRQRMRSYMFEISYFQTAQDNMAFHHWAETMYREFEQITVDGRLFHITNAKAQPGEDMAFRFVCNIDFVALTGPAQGEPMEKLTLKDLVKE